ncbi:hypothetical protein BE221DRAFT_81381, partial [Ostreococcus tauri]
RSIAISSIRPEAPPLRAKRALRSLSMWSLVMMHLDGSTPTWICVPVSVKKNLLVSLAHFLARMSP